MSLEQHTGAIGELNPPLTIQQNPKACLSACLLSEIPRSADLDESDITQVLEDDGLYVEGLGTGLFPAAVFNASLEKLGLYASAVYDARLASDNEEEKVKARQSSILNALRNHQKVIIAYPKMRPGQEPFLHYSNVTGCTGTNLDDEVVLMDPSEIDGAIKCVSWAELATQYLTPTEAVPVMAWGISDNIQETSIPEPESTKTLGRLGLILLSEPLCRESDTGTAIPPGTKHAVSVAIPTKRMTEGFNSLGDVSLSRGGKHPFGYPRFVPPPAVRQLSEAVTGGSNSLAFPTLQSAEAAAFLERMYGEGTEITKRDGLFWLDDSLFNAKAWQNTGLGISSRQATATLEGRPRSNEKQKRDADRTIKGLIEFYTGAKPEDVYLFPTGMAAMYWLNQALIKLSNGAPAIEFGFPYTDNHEQNKYGPHKNPSSNILDYRDGNYDRLQALVRSGQALRGLMTELPSNPLLATPDIERLDEILDGATPIVIDDTIATIYNLDDKKLPSSVVARVTSLTKFFSSVGNVMGGSVILRPESPHYDQLKKVLDDIYEDTLWYEDVEVLAQNSASFRDYMPIINRNGRELAEWLENEWRGDDKPLQTIYYPRLNNDRAAYEKVMKHDSGYGGLMSLRFNDSERGYSFFDMLRVTKGPGFGTLYTLGCLYTRLAHQFPSSVEKFGVTPDLVRLSIGIENIDELKKRFKDSLRLSAQ